MTIDTGWIALAALALFVGWLGWTVLRSRGRRSEAPPAAERPADVEAIAPAPVVVPPVGPPAVTVEPPVVAPVRELSPKPMPEPTTLRATPIEAPAALTTSAPSPAPAPTVTVVTESVTEAPRPVRPAAPRFERVLGVQAGDEAAWAAAVPTPLSANQADTLASTCTAAVDAVRSGSADAPALLLLAFPAGSILRIARGDAEMMKSLSADNETSTLRTWAWLDSKAASSAASALLAAIAAPRHLDDLNDEAQDIKATFTALPPRLAGLGGGRLKTLVQELSRFMREVRDNYAAAISRAAFRERVDDACVRALESWRELHAQRDASRLALGAEAAASRFGEAQLARALAGLRTLQDERRLQQLLARLVAALHVLRVPLGGSGAHAGANPLQSASAALRASGDEDAALIARLRVAEQAAQGDPYVGRTEFEAQRAAMRKLLDGLAAPAADEGGNRLGAAQAAVAEGFPDLAGGDDRWLLRVDAAGAAVEARRASVVRLH